MNKFKYIAEETIPKPTWQQNEIGRRFLIMSGEWKGYQAAVNKVIWNGKNAIFEIFLSQYVDTRFQNLQNLIYLAKIIYMSEDEYLKVALEAESERPPLLAALPQMVAQQNERMKTIQVNE